MSKTSRTADLPTQPAVHEPFADTLTPEDYYTDSVRGLLDEEFSADVPREAPSFWARLVLVSTCFACASLTYSTVRYVLRMFWG